MAQIKYIAIANVMIIHVFINNIDLIMLSKLKLVHGYTIIIQDTLAIFWF